MNGTPYGSEDLETMEGGLPAPEATPVVVVDDEQPVLDLLGKILEGEGYPVEAFASAQDALSRIAVGGVALLITDVRMPAMSGIELARRALEEDPDLAILVLTGAADTESAVESFRLGVEDYLTKPIAPDTLVEAVDRALRQRRQQLYRHKFEVWLRAEVDRRTEQVVRQSEELERVSVAALSALVRAMEAKDPYLKGHSARVAELSEKLALQLDFEPAEVEEIRMAGLLHDIGMIGIRESVVNKRGQLTEEEYRHVQEHVEIGAGILQPLTHIGRTIDHVFSHHERINGSGYPRGLEGNEVPLGAQAVGLAESYVSLTESRAHREAYDQENALATLRRGSGVWFEPRVIEALEDALQA
jgi:putative nucleotidyltransferase with HDIG domain